MIIIAFSLFFALILGWLRGGSLLNLENQKINFPLFFFAGLIFQIPLRFTIPYFHNLNINLLGNHLYIISLLFILMTIIMNFRTAGFKILFTGSFLNFLVITANGGKMPISLKAIEIAGMAKDLESSFASGNWLHFEIIKTGETLFPFLGDIIPLPLGPHFSRVISPGDLFIGLGVFFFIYYSMRTTLKTT